MTDTYGIGLPIATEYGELNIFDFSGTKGMKKELDLAGSITTNSKIKWQKETCVCDLGDRCNIGGIKNVINIFLLIICTISCLFFGNLNKAF